MTRMLFVLLLLTASGCKSEREKEPISFFEERQPGFFHLRFGYEPSNQWIRKPDNILMLHETFKKIGYQKLISNYKWTENPSTSYAYVNHSLKNLIDSLEITYSNPEDAPKYYREFWQRRRVEKNIEAVYQVISEVKKIMVYGEELEINEEKVNDTLLTLLSFEYPERRLTDAEANEQLDYLIAIGFHQSAYNLITGERAGYEGVKWVMKKEDVLKQIKPSAIYQRAWLEDNTK